MIQVDKIRCKVTLQSYMEGKAVDLTPHVRGLTITKGLYQHAGQFEIQLLPGLDKNKASWYYRTSPMDYIEIRFTRDWRLTKIPIVLRGFVETVGMTSSVDYDGKPIRIYTIQGSDLGKIFDITRIYYLKEVTKDLQLIYLPGFKKFEQKYGYNVDDKPVAIIKTLFDVAKNQLSLIRRTQTALPEIKYLASSSILGEVNQFALSQEDGSIWDMMSFFDNSPWNELFTVDLEDGFYLVFRETPWKDYKDGNYIQAVDPEVDKKTLGESVKIPPGSIVSFNLQRSDVETKNYFFTYPVQNAILAKTPFKASILPNVETEEDLNKNPYMIPYTDRDAGAYRFGFRRFENTSEYFDIKNMVNSQELAEKFNLALYEAFKYNSAYESGSFTLKGNAELRPGRYMIFNRQTNVTPEYYIVGVRHELTFTNNQEHFLTTVEVQRGDGYLKTRDMANNTDQAMRQALK